MDVNDMIAEVNNANTGQELITPQFMELSQGEGGCTAANGCFTVRFKISKIVPTNAPNWAPHLYYTPQKVLSYPTCADNETAETDWEPKFVRVGNTMTAGLNVSTSCDDPNTTHYQSYEKTTTYLYMTDVSAANGSTKIYSYPAGHLIGLNTTSNLNNSGSGTDLMTTMIYMEGSNAGALRIDVFEPATSSRYISNMAIADR